MHPLTPSAEQRRNHGVVRPFKSLSLTANPGFSGRYLVFPGPLRFPAPNPTNVPNRCSPKPFPPETPEKPLLLVCRQRRLTLQVVCRSLPHFQLPKPFSQTRLPTHAPVTAARMNRRLDQAVRMVRRPARVLTWRWPWVEEALGQVMEHGLGCFGLRRLHFHAARHRESGSGSRPQVKHSIPPKNNLRPAHSGGSRDESTLLTPFTFMPTPSQLYDATPPQD
jgi:hypothetical protein